MHRITTAILLAAPWIAGTARAEAPVDASKTATTDTASLAQANNAFALRLLGVLKRPGGNLIVSPFSIETAFAMTYAGARGETATEMARVFGFPNDDAALHPAIAALERELEAKGDPRAPKIRIVNALWGQQDLHVLEPFRAALRQHYGAGLREADFRSPGAREAARNAINTWVEQQTEGRIKDLIGPGDLDAATRLVLTNAIYFKGAWAEPFSKAATRDEPFTRDGGTKADVKMMARTGSYRYRETDDLQVLELPYAGGRLAMDVLLPKQVDGLGGVESALQEKKLSALLGQLGRERVEVHLPRWTMTAQFELSEALKGLGLTRAFSNEADFSGITPDAPLRISKALHKAFVAVDEEGTEAAAATGVTVGLTAAPLPKKPILFRADHPYLFLIRDTRSGAVLFLGRVLDPR
ncbi:MAG: serpin family protein [Isosphaeraceae bacterium]|nr:serpin family protein [Isosphaeraceae bacterium]